MTIKKNIIAITIGEIMFPNNIPNLNHNLLIGVKILEFIKPKIKKTAAIQSGKIFISSILPRNDQKAIIENTTKNTKPKFRLELIFIFDLFDILNNLIYQKN